MKSCYDIWMVILTVFSVLGSFLIAAIAIWQDKFRPKPKFVLELKSKIGKVVNKGSGNDQRYYHLVVKNLRTWSAAKNVKIILRQVLRPDASGNFVVSSRHNFQLTWSPAYAHDVTPNILKVDELDVGFISKSGNYFAVLLYGAGIIPEATIKPNESMIIGLDIIADNYSSQDMWFFKINWNGQWEDDDSKSQNNLVITRLKKDSLK